MFFCKFHDEYTKKAIFYKKKDDFTNLFIYSLYFCSCRMQFVLHILFFHYLCR